MNLSSILTFLKKDNHKYLHIGIITASVFCLLVTYFVEYGMNISPCPLCIYQRFPYLYLIKLSATALLIKKFSKNILIFIMLTLICACLLAGYHTGIERKIFTPSSLCTTKIHIPKHLNITDIKNMFADAPTSSCSEVPFKIFGLSMTEYNLLFNLFMLVFIIIIYLT